VSEHEETKRGGRKGEKDKKLFKIKQGVFVMVVYDKKSASHYTTTSTDKRESKPGNFGPT